MAEPYVEQVEYLDVLTKIGKKIGKKIGGSKPRGDVHRDGDYHKAVHVWIFTESTQELLLQKRADCKDSWPGLWDISSAGHISAGDSSLITAQYKENNEARSLILQKQLRRYAPVSLTAEETSSKSACRPASKLNQISSSILFILFICNLI
ncbi:hypothetical protein ES319_A11G050300v1 [Gossypium barbadense]|uniref:Nudix hydrolase domain-containing protein n=4 Tax=Gossypium TaxID=3633 RepID=A0A5J5TNM5_GOSBA|nr:hypothetical protein ES319_A11G050300v1 [Gossypium barbadense]TYG92693.1 hypothetical protein ES288_A11G052400v1 [Gossypium darwinii]TYI17653.1 hypothetical protein ES332_A07G040300v1 [Gossypium tomentosum]KAB2055628.1 hypothetical protein ES319_A11G050300v1 [Gossypium barbadense]KAB2055629.1 hypothetical protein ES319_A11G050300v1 [Gossypium barbadense]